MLLASATFQRNSVAHKFPCQYSALPFSAVVLTIALLKGSTGLRAGNDEADTASSAIRPQAIRADMQFLADDLLEERGTGTRGHEIAAKFMAAEFQAMGLEPAGDNGTFFQNVPLRSIRPDEERTTLSIVQGGKEEALRFRQDFVTLGDRGRTEVSVRGQVVYVGFGVTAPEQGYDDYAGLEANGKIVAFLYGAPLSFEAAIRAHLQLERRKGGKCSRAWRCRHHLAR